MSIGIRMEGRRRRLYAADHRFNTRFHARRAAATHRMLERRVVLQAVGRVRPFTTPAEIILFQCDDLSSELGPIEEFSSLAAARRALWVPTLCQLKRAVLGEKIRARQKGGESLRTSRRRYRHRSFDRFARGESSALRSAGRQHPVMAVITLLPEFEEAIADLPEPEPWTLPIRPNTGQLGAGTPADRGTGCRRGTVSQLNRLPLGAIAIDTEFRFASAPVDSAVAGSGRTRRRCNRCC